MRQNAEAILARAGFKRVINMIKYQDFMPDPSDDPSDGENFTAGTPTPSSASAPKSDDTAATLPNPAHQNAMQIFVFDGFKRVLSVIKCQEFMPDPSDS